ncbi:serine protease, partial [Patescibacteria group bacterium]|nr:serine protease [Patescibacteria group bacterium]
VTAQTTPFSIQQAVVWVHCGNRQGSGVMINEEKGYLLTNAHILLNLSTLLPESCEVGFVDDATLKPKIFYDASFVKYIFDENNNKDFAILKLTKPQQDEKIAELPFLKTDEFSRVNDPISIMAFPSVNKGKQLITNGTISGLEQGIVKTNAVISPGASGGAGIDSNNNLIGIATRILLRETSPGVEEVVDYELVDIRSIINWLDTFGENAHDAYITHADFERYHGPTVYFTISNLNCSMLARTASESGVYCLKPDGTRFVFPNSTTYMTWFADYSGVMTVTADELAPYRLARNITIKPGTLVKIATDPRVYLVSDIDGTLRWIQNEDKAVELFGEGWAGFVKDVPDTFFTNYQMGYPVQ